MKAIRKIKRTCRSCGGKGWKMDHAVGICTFGLGYLIQAIDGRDQSKDERFYCRHCGGKGYIIEKEEIEIID